MASGKRASMREGPLADLFRRTERGRRGGRRAGAPKKPARERAPRPRRAPSRRRPGAPRAAEPATARPRRDAATRTRRSAPTPERAAPSRVPRHADAAGAPAPRVQLGHPREHPRAPARPHGASRASRRTSRRAPSPSRADPWSAPQPAGSPCSASSASAAPASTPSTAWSRRRSQGVEFVAVNTDLQSLQQSTADITLHIGRRLTRGLGAGAEPRARSPGRDGGLRPLKALLKGSDMVFIAAGAGGGTGTGAAPIVARIARELGALTVGIVTKPFGFEGTRRAAAAADRHRGAGRRGRHADRRAQQPAAQRARQADVDGRRLPRRRRRAAPGRPGRQSTS